MTEQAPNRTARDYAYNSAEHEVQYFRGLMEKTLSQSRTATSSDSIVELTKALVKAQKAFETPKRTVQGQVGNHKYMYADLQSVYDAVRKPLAENGLCITHLMQEFVGQVELVTMLLHESGEYLKSVYPIKGAVEKPQAFGSAVTYAKRYALSALLGIASEDDDDAAGAQASQRNAKRTNGSQASQEADLGIMNPETGEIQQTFQRTAGGARAFMEALETNCAHSSKFWVVNSQQAQGIAQKLPQLLVGQEPIGDMVERMASLYGSVDVGDDTEIPS